MIIWLMTLIYLYEYIYIFKNHMLLWQEIRLCFSHFEKSDNIHVTTKKDILLNESILISV